MDLVTQTKVLFRGEQWKKIIAECQASGLPVKTWCDQNSFKEQSYYYYLKKIRKQEIEKIPVALPDPMDKAVLFKKLEVQTPIHTQAAVIIHLPSYHLKYKMVPHSRPLRLCSLY